MDYVIWAFIGTCYGMLVGIIPIAGVTTALITVFSMGAYFMADPYLGLVFLTAIVASCASADSYTSILTGIPGASTTAACVIDGYPMAKKGQATIEERNFLISLRSLLVLVLWQNHLN